MRKLVIAALLLGATGSAAIARDRNTPPAALADGKPVDCLSLTQIRETRVYGDNTIDFHTNGNKVYRNALPQSCPSLGFEERFSYRTSLNRLCSVDIIRVLQSYGGELREGAGCGLGKFQPVKLASAN